jgi:dTDP-glucose 4,6-dehydratase
MLLLEKFNTKPDSVIVLDALTYSGKVWNLKEVSSLNNFEFVKGNICDSALMEKLISKVDVIVNFAAESHVDRSIESSKTFIESNVLGVANILDVLKKYPSKKFIQISTDEVYGSIDTGSWTEDFPLAPNSPYAASKAAADLLVLAFHKTHGLDARITRCSNNFGPNQHPEKIIPLFLMRLLANQKVPIYGDGANFREWIYVEDHCRGIWEVIDSGSPGEIYNIGSGHEMSNLELTLKLVSYFPESDNPIEYVEYRKGHDSRYSVDSSKIRTELGFKCEIDFESGLLQTVDWYKQFGKEFLTLGD